MKIVRMHPPMGVNRSRYTRSGKYAKKLPSVRTVGELIQVLQQLPKTLPVLSDAGMDPAGVLPVWYNVGQPNEHVAFTDGKEIKS